MKFDIYRGPKSGNSQKISFRRKLRRDMIPAEKLFWAKVGDRQLSNLKFRRQHAIGNYIVDFYCPGKKLVIEIDGDTHADPTIDFERDQYIKSLGYSIVRYQNREVLRNIEGVFEDLVRKLG